jgi:hypothetical protein
MVTARLSRLRPGGSWVVVTESEEFATTLEGTVKLRGGKVMRREFPSLHDAAPVSAHPRDTSRIALVISH